jgi:hypothetical protein
MYWAAFQSCLGDNAPGDPLVKDEEAMDKCVEKLTGAILEVTASSAPKCLHRSDSLPPVSAGIQDKIRLKKELKMQQKTTRDPALKNEVNRFKKSATCRLKERRKELWRDVLESLDSEDQSLWKMTNTAIRLRTPSLPFNCQKD